MLSHLYEDINSNEKFTVTREWMSDNYDKMNEALFDSRLGDCSFMVKPLNGKTLGLFNLDPHIKVDTRTRDMVLDGWPCQWINRSNFVQCARPSIIMNSNYKFTQKAALSVLVHEMCHYYNHMEGYAPKLAHGPEFKAIAAEVSARSNDIFTVQRLADAEEMSEMELDPNVADRENQRLDKRYSKAITVFVFRKDGNIEMMPTLDESLVSSYLAHHLQLNDAVLAKVTTNPEIQKILRTHRFGLLQKPRSLRGGYKYYQMKEGTNLLDILNSGKYEEFNLDMDRQD